MDKNSFGTIVVSNAENVVSTKAKTFPTVGAIKLNGNAYTIDSGNAVLRLPSNIFKVNWVDMVKQVRLVLEYTYEGTNLSTKAITFVNYDFLAIKNQFINAVNTWTMTGGTPMPDNVKEDFIAEADQIANKVLSAMTTRFWYNDNYDPANATFIPRTDIQGFYSPKVSTYQSASLLYNGNIALTNSELGTSIYNTYGSFYYKRGTNEITNFIFLGDTTLLTGKHTYLYDYDSTQLGQANVQPIYKEYDSGTRVATATFERLDDSNNFITTRNTFWRVNYIPMSDLKIKYDNSGDSNDIQLYNQVGKLTDGVSLSKLMLSYSKEIESDTITKYLNGYDFDTLPKVGDGVSIGTNAYIINNVSYDFYENESGDTEFDYYIVGEYTMSKWTSTKSLLTNPNTNIRDYGIPQNNNVARKQLYRDFYELSKSFDPRADTDYYMTFNKIFNLTNYYKGLNEHVAVMKLTFKNAYGGGGTYYDDEPVEPSDTWYYQLDTTTYILKKAVYEVVNLNDNNIIGYCSQNVNSAFDVRRILLGTTIQSVNTPISYVDTNGQVESFYISMCNIDQITDIYNNYQREQENKYGRPYAGTLYNFSIFIPSEIYEGGVGEEVIVTSVPITQEITGSYNAVIERTIYNCNISALEILPDDYSGSASDMSVSVISCVDENGVDRLGTLELASITLSNDIYRARFVFNSNTEHTMTITFTISYPYETQTYQGAKDICDFSIDEEDYNKDALEVPVFEYSCQIDDTEEVVVGENILETQSGDKYAYSYYLVDKNTINENTFNSIELEEIHLDNDIVTNEEIAFWDKAVVFEYDSSEIKISLYGQCDKLNLENETTPSYSSRVTLTPSMFVDKDLVIARHKIPEKYTNEFVDPFYNLNTTNELLFVVKGIVDTTIVDNKIVLKINHYKIR